jgi:hypothetical protein
MAYIINKFNGEQLLVLEDGTLNDDLSVGLLGKNTIGYGEIQNENFVHLLENFAGNAPPSGTILTGQTFFDTSTNQLKFYDGNSWNLVGHAIVSDIPPSTTISGTTWIKTTTQQLFVYNNGWQQIGPEAVEGFSTTKASAVSVKDTFGNNHAILQLVVNGSTIAICSSTAFGLDNSVNPIAGFNSVRIGINLSSNYDITGNLNGNSLTATRLQNSRTINGVNFDGTENIVITARTDNTLIRGTYLTGNNFDGSAEVIWAVDASTETSPNKVVVRDNNGDFSARLISSSLKGDVFGNVTANTGTSYFTDLEAKKLTGTHFGNTFGNASTASKLERTIKINSVDFDGASNITVKANTNQPLSSGQHINGQPFDGSTALAWDIITASSNDFGKIVARDENGNFRASTITSNLVGNVTGNITSAGTSSFNLVNATQVTTNVIGNVSGNSGSATKLQFARTINGVEFDGAANIIIKSSTTRPLVRGSYLTGSNFDGSAEITWAVDAASDGVANKVVVRDSQGSFSANIVTANFVGAVTGNVTGNITGNLSGTTTGSHIGPVSGNVTGNLLGNVTGNLIGNVTGASSLNLLKTGDTMSGNINWGITDRGLNWSMNTDGASIKFYNISDGDTDSRLEFETRDNGNEYFRWTHSRSGSGLFENMRLVPNSTGASVLTVSGDVVATRKVESPSFLGTLTGNVIGNVAGNSLTATRLQTPRTINGVSFNGTENIVVQATDPTKAPNNSPSLTGIPRSVTPPKEDESTRIATTAFVKQWVPGTPLWAGVTTLSNVISTYSNFPEGTKVAFWEERIYFRPANSNGGSVQIDDRYRRVVEKRQFRSFFGFTFTSWIDVGG